MSVPWPLRLLVSAAVVVLLIVLIVPIRDLGHALARASLPVWLGVTGAFLLAHLVAAAKWRVLVGHGADGTGRRWVVAHFAGLVANLCLPGVAGGDVVRAGWLMRRSASPDLVAAGSLVDRVVDTGALLALAAVGVALAGRRAGEARDALRVVIVLVALLAAAAALGWFVLRRMVRRGLLARGVAAVEAVLARPGALALAMLLSCVVQGSLVALNVWLGASAGLVPGWAAWLTAWPLAKLVALVPVSLAGLGVREAALIAFMRPFGAEPSIVLAVGLLWQAVLAVGGLVGWAAATMLARER
jgi:uncharacterized membrane protein YbhN (UPF0104 family)